MSNLNKITAVVVLYNTTELVFQCLDKIKGIKIIIVDNGKNEKRIIDLVKNNYNIFNLKNSLKNLAKIYAIYLYLKK